MTCGLFTSRSLLTSCEPGQLPHLLFEDRRPVIQLVGVGVLQRELIQRRAPAGRRC